MRASGETLRDCGEHGLLPLRSPCPSGCRFCYETHLPRLIPNLALARWPAYTPEAFDLLCEGLAGSDQPATPVSPLWVADGQVHYSSMSDIFCQGLSREQLERLVRHNVGRERRELATTGNHLDPETAAYLTRTYPETFRLHYSVVTLSAALRARLFTRCASPETVLATVAALREPKLYLCHLDPAQTISDLQALNAHVQPGARVQLARVHCTRLHSAEVRGLARRSGQGLAEVVDWLASHRAALDRIDEIGFQAPPEGYAWTFRDELREAVRPLRLGRGDVVLCSPAAREVLRREVVPAAAAVVPVFDSLGATTSFTTTLGVGNLLAVLRELRERQELRRVALPTSIFWVQDRYAIDGRSADDLRAQLPGLEVVLVEIPQEMRRARLSLEQCRDYFGRNPQARGQGDYRDY
jgi:hypothetical protein